MSKSGSVAFYARVSSEAQAHAHTIDSQIAALKERIAADGFELEPDHGYTDDGWSGTNLQRPALEKLRDAVAGGDVERIYVHAPDRLARRHAHQVLLIEEFRRSGAEIVFLNRAIGHTAEDELLLQVQGIIAEYERTKILERARRGRRHAARSGAVSALTGAPFGYRYISCSQGGGVARFEVVDDEARIVRSIFGWIGLDRLSLRDVCRRLQQMAAKVRAVCGIGALRRCAAFSAIQLISVVPCSGARASLRPDRGRACCGVIRPRYRALRGALQVHARNGSRLQCRP
jgi:site-specific DNA recombinase